ncbi:MAG: NnrU family protein [Silicimonas sp.]
MGWFEFAAAYAAFFLSHRVPVRPPIRTWLQARLGRGGFTLAYSLLSVAALAWLIGAAGRAPYVQLWGWAPWQAYVPLSAMLPVCLILALSMARPNPFSFGGARNDRFDPSRPGIVRWARHPLLLALALWAAAHVVPNGDLAHVILFGSFTGFAILGGRLVDRRKRREMGADWHQLQAAVARAPKVSLPISGAALMRLVTGAALYSALLWAHPFLFGVSPIP